MKRVFKIFAAFVFALSVAFVGVNDSNVAEAGRVVSRDGIEIIINDASVYRISSNHANAQVKIGQSAPILVSVRWGKGFDVCQIDSNGNRIGNLPSDTGSAIADYFYENY